MRWRSKADCNPPPVSRAYPGPLFFRNPYPGAPDFEKRALRAFARQQLRWAKLSIVVCVGCFMMDWQAHGWRPAELAVGYVSALWLCATLVWALSIKVRAAKLAERLETSWHLGAEDDGIP